jgi:threonyl-tRNA synthetase
MVIVGSKEQTAGTLSVRERDGKVSFGVKPEEFVRDLRARADSFQ